MTHSFSTIFPPGLSINNPDPQTIKSILGITNAFASSNTNRLAELFWQEQERLVIFWALLIVGIVLLIVLPRWIVHIINYYRGGRLGTVRGVALLISLLLIIVITGIGVGQARLTLAEIRQSSRIEDSIGAESVAESGIEHGLLLYRFNHDVELSKECPDPDNCSESPTETDGTPKVFYLAKDGKTKPDWKYELKIWHRNGNDGTGSQERVESENGKPALGKDQVVEYDLSRTKTDIPFPQPLMGNLYLKWEYTDEVKNYLLAHPEEAYKYCLEYTATHYINGLVHKDLFDYTDSLDPAGKFLITTGATKLRLRSWGGDLESYTLTYRDDPDEKLDSRYTIIESTGYFGNTKRKLQVKIDRHSGQLLGLYDFVLYSGEGSIEGP